MFRFVTTELAFVYGGGDSGLSRFLKTVSKRLDADPNADIQPMEQQFIDNALAGAWDTCRRTLGRDPDRWNASARRRLTNRKLGYYESLDGFPSLDEAHDIRFPALICPDGATVFSQAAQAYVQWVPLGAVDDARSLLPPGHSELPRDPMRLVNLERWAQGQLNPAPLSRAAVERIAHSTRVLLPKTE
jgi:acyl-homoserine lactone acylase PvdQ